MRRTPTGAVFTACRNSPPEIAARLAELRTAQLCAALDLFLARLRTDPASAGRPRDPRLRGPVTEWQTRPASGRSSCRAREGRGRSR
ncbi:hypothetical protein [Embleya sp. AB8]|uniref:hypothetical protein n=1 Tax=Embleya sp. AB8 TaxID=3156304 RepID=UPI003C76BD51